MRPSLQAWRIDASVYGKYLRARRLSRNREFIQQSLSQYRATVRQAPDFAPGWSSLALALAHSARWDVEGAVMSRLQRNAELPPTAPLLSGKTLSPW